MGALATRIHELDRRWLLGVARRQVPRWVDRVFRTVTHLGGATATLALGAALAVPAVTRRLGVAVLLANAGSHLVVQLIKRTASRPRPEVLGGGEVTALVAHPDEFSLPSGHSAAAMAVALTLVLWRGQPAVPGAMAALALAVALLVGMSRVYLRVHYVTDVLLGQVLGVVAAVIVTR